MDCFLRDTSETLRWPIANTMSLARPYGISVWLVEAVKNRSFGNAREMLVIALARLAPAEQALPILMSVLDELPGHVAMAIGEIGGPAELGVLKSRVESIEGPGWRKAEMLKAIRRIEKRLRKRGE